MEDKDASILILPDSLVGKLKSFDISNIPSMYPAYDSEIVNRETQEIIQNIEMDSAIPEGYFEKTQDYQQKSLEILQDINQNTANLYTIVELISQSNDKQDELISLTTEVLSLAKAKSKDEADTRIKKIMSNINNTADSVDSMIKMVGWASTIYKMVLSLLP